MNIKYDKFTCIKYMLFTLDTPVLMKNLFDLARRSLNLRSLRYYEDSDLTMTI